MAVASARFPSRRPALPSTPWSGLMRAPRRRGSSLEEAPLGAATPLRAPAAADHLSGPRPGLLCAPRNRRRRMVSPAHPLAACAFPCSAPRLPRKLQNLPKKSARNCLSPARTPEGFGLARDSFPLHPEPDAGASWRCGPGAWPPKMPVSHPPRASAQSARLSRTPWSGTVRHCLPTGRPA